MGYIKKLKNNELVGGTDKTTIYPVTSTKAVFEEVTESDKSSFQSQESINTDRLERIETLEAHDENHEGRVSTLEEHDSDHESRVQELESVVPDTIRSISINGGTEHTVDESGNVDLTIYTVNPDDPDVPAMVDLVEKNRDDIADIKEEIGTDTTQNTLSGRITELETLVGGNEQGSVNQRIEDAVGALDVLPGLSSNYDSNEGDDYNVHVGVSLEEENGKIKNLNLEAENIAPANKLEELYNYTHNLNETDVVVGAKPAASAALTNTVYRVPSDPDAAHYTDYMKYDTEMVPLATYDIAGEEAQVGCYTGTISGTALSVTAANNANTSISAYALKNGGHFKVKVPSAATNTSGGWTLSMKGLAAKQLLYNGQAVSYTNTWEAGETISVYYDNTGNGAYYASNAQGGSNKKIDAYLYGDLRTLAVGQTYKFDESVKTTDKQFLRITKAITTLSMSETLAVGDLKVNSNKTYRADKAINVYNPEGDYTENPYALGSLAEYTLTVTAENVVECTITVNGTEVSVDEGESAASIATKIVAALGDIEGWTISRNENIITVRCNTIGANTTTITITGTEETGITVDSTLVAGTNVIRKYDGTSWINAEPGDLVTDEVLIEVVDAAWLAANAAKQNTIAKDFYDVEINFKVGAQNKAISPARQGVDKWYSGSNGKSYFVPIEGGLYYMITANATTWVSFLKNNVGGSHNAYVTNFATGETACHTISSGKSVVLKAPFDAKYLLVTYYNYGDITPKSVIKVSLFNVFNKADFINFDNTTSKIESNNVQDAIVEVLNIADLADKRGVYKLTSADYINNRQISGGGVGAWVYAKYTTGYVTSKPIYLHKGDTISLASFGTNHNTCAFAEWHMNNYKVLVTYAMWAEGTTSYTAERDMFVCAGKSSNGGDVTVSRNSILIDNLANYHYDDNRNDYFYRLFGEVRIPEFTTVENKFIDANNGYAPSGDTWSLYTSPIFLSKGESIFVSFPAGYASSNSMFTLSDAEGNPIGGLSYTTRSGFGKYPTINMYQAIEDCYVIISGRGRYVLPYIVSDSVLQSYFNRIEGEARGDIMSLWGTTETLLKLRQLNRQYNEHNTSEGPTDKRKGAYNPWIIVHFSDIHNDGTNLRRIETFASYYKQQTDHLDTNDVLIDDVLDTGDNVLATAGGAIPWNTNNIAATFLNTIGNHDMENMNSFTYDGVTGWPAIYKKQMGQFRSQWGNVVFPSENVEEEGKCYYYKDYTSQNIRLIVLMNWTNTTTAYLNNEYAWFESVLNDALTKNLTVVCAGHVKPGNLTPIDGCSFHTHEYGYETQDNASQFVILVDKFIRAGGAFACWLAGHTHYDLTGWVNSKYTENGVEYIVNNQLCVVVENAGGQNSEYERRYWNSDTRIAGTKSQDCFNIVCVNAAYYRVSVMRIGSQYDNSGQHKGGFCINYKTKKMLSCY